ncbi:MAG: hypothetical protein ABIJ05_02020 [Patescibacteria group bacterium]
MNNPLKSDPVKQGKNLAQQIAKQIAKEPFEIAKSALKQVSGLETSDGNKEVEIKQNENQNVPQENDQLLEQQKKAQGQRQLQALENEMKEIVEKKKMEKQQEDFIEKQEDVLKEEEKENSPLLIPTSKKPRNIFAGLGRKPKKTSGLQAERQKTRVERVMPPAG